MVDDMCFVHSMTANSNTHGPGENQMGNTGFTLEGYPSMGAWVSYATGQRVRRTCPRSSPSPTRAA